MQHSLVQLADTRGDPLAFYSTAATLIPVVFFAIAFEARVLDLIQAKTRFIAAYLMGAAALGAEVISLHILVHRDPSQRAAQTISSVLLGLGLAALAGPLIRSLDRDADERERDEVALRQAALDADAEQQHLQKEVDVITRAATTSIEVGEALITQTDEAVQKSQDALARIEALGREGKNDEAIAEANRVSKVLPPIEASVANSLAIDEKRQALAEQTSTMKTKIADYSKRNETLSRLADDLKRRRKAAGFRFRALYVVTFVGCVWLVGSLIIFGLP